MARVEQVGAFVMETGHAEFAQFVGGVACIVFRREVAHLFQEGFVLVQGILMLAGFVGVVGRFKREGPILLGRVAGVAIEGKQEAGDCEKEGLHVHACSVRWAKDLKVSARSSTWMVLAP